MNRLANKRTILFGGSRGIGKALVLNLAREGAHVLFTYHGNDKAAHEVERAARESSGTAQRHKADLTSVADINATFDTAQKAFGGPPQLVVINAFPAPVFMPIAQFDEPSYDAMFAATKGTFFALQQAANTVEDGGTILVVSSGAAMNAQFGNGVYAGAKAAVERFALSLAKELGSKQISVNAVSPGFTKTEEFNMPDDMQQMLVSQTPFGRLGRAEDVANAMLAFVLPETKWITGQVVQANGGIF